jgi:hypothetical protein
MKKSLQELGVDSDRIQRSPSLGSIILLAHSQAMLTIPALQNFLPFMLTSIQTNVALSETLALLLNTFGPLRSARSESSFSVPPELAFPLMHTLPYLASAHPDPSKRHISFRLFSLMLSLVPLPLRMQLLKDMLTDEEMPEQIQVSGVGLVKEALLEALVEDSVVLPVFMDVFGPILFRARLPSTGDLEQSLQEFLESPEPLRLIESLGLLYVVLQRDTVNKVRICLIVLGYLLIQSTDWYTNQ